jgi:hypothetical protein
MTPSVQVTASANAVTQIRSSAGQYNGFFQQGGIEVLERIGFRSSEGPRVAREALELVGAAACPSGSMELLLMPDQMMLQIHESVGHPLELDRILGDERNHAGTSFVTLDMFGNYQYGSELLNVSFDPRHDNEFAGFAFDADGTPAERALLIERGLLKRPLGGSLSQARARAQGFRPRRRGDDPLGGLEPRSDRPHEQHQRGAREQHAGEDNRRYRAWCRDAHQLLVEHRRFAQQVPVWLRVRAHGAQRPARRGGAQRQLPRHQRRILALAVDGGRCWHGRGDGLAVLRQGRTCAGHSGRACLPGVQVFECPCLRRSTMMDAALNINSRS